MSTISDIEKKLAIQAQRLETLTGVENQRIRKRIFCKISSLKKELADLKASSEELIKINSSNENFNDDCKLSLGVPEDRIELTHKQKKAKLKLLNKELSDLAQKKLLREANKRFRWCIRKGLQPDVHTYTNLINANVRCENNGGAEELFQTMVQSGITPNVVTYTTMIKAYAQSGDLQSATNMLLRDMKTHRVDPNLRTINTFLRGCVRIGAIDTAMYIFSQLSRGGVWEFLGVVPDDSSYEHVVSLLSQGLRMTYAAATVAEYRRHRSSESEATATTAGSVGDTGWGEGVLVDNPAVYVAMARGYAILGDISEARKWLICSQKAMEEANSAGLRNTMLKKRKYGDWTSNGRDADGLTDADPAMPSKSLELFRAHRLAEISLETSLIGSYLERCDAANQSETSARRLSHLLSTVDKLCRVLVFPYWSEPSTFNLSAVDSNGLTVTGHGSSVQSAEGGRPREGKKRGRVLVACEQLGACWDRVGLVAAVEATVRYLSRSRQQQTQYPRPQSSSQDDDECVEAMLKYILKMQLKTVGIVDGDPASSSTRTLDLRQLFSSHIVPLSALISPKTDGAHIRLASEQPSLTATAPDMYESSKPQRPVYMEICSGHGDWVTSQAKQTTGESDWLAVELRCDRGVGIASRAVLKDVCNLSVLIGDAGEILAHHLPRESVSGIFINHPQPPERSSGEGDSQGAHLLTQAFFAQMHSTLVAHGTIAIVSDNLPYIRSLALSIGAMKPLLFATETHARTPFGRRENTGAEATSSTSSGARNAHKRGGKEGKDVANISQNTSSLRSLGEYYEAHEQVGSITLWKGDPGPEVGYCVDQSSYFDRLWDRGEKKRRWFLYIVKLNSL